MNLLAAISLLFACDPELALPELQQQQETPMLVVIAGQSNAVGGALVADITDPAVEAEMAADYPTVQLGWRMAISKAEPVPWTTHAYSALAPRGVNDAIGVEVSLGRTLGAISHIYKFAVTGTGLQDNWHPSSPYPTLEPTNLYTQFVTYVQAQIAATGKRLGAIVWIQANQDANALATANAYAENLETFLAALREDLGEDWVFIFNQYHPGMSGPYQDVVRAEQKVFADAHQGDRVVMVTADDLTLRDGDHYSADASVELGRLFGYALVPYIAGGYLMAGTTFEDIRDKQLDLLRALLPTEVPSQPFRAWEANESDFAAWADAGGGPFRTVEIEHGFDYPDEKYLDIETGSVVHTERVLVSYPNVRELAGRLLDYIIDRDIIDIQKALGQRGYGSYAELGAGEHVAQLTGVEVERRRAARVLRLTFQLSYDRSIP